MIKLPNPSIFVEGISLIFVGDELLSGHTNNTSARTLSVLFAQSGYKVIHQTVIADDEKSIKNEILQDKSRVIVICGGLGFTKDDETLSAVADALDRELVYDQDYLTVLQDLQQKKNLDDDFLLQARKPDGAILVEHCYGTAPFIVAKRFLEKSSKDNLFGWIYCLAGVPGECTNVAKYFLLPHLKKHLATHSFFSFQVVVMGISELAMQKILKNEGFLEKYNDIKVSYLPRGGEELFLGISSAKEEAAHRATKLIFGLLLDKGYYAYIGSDNFSLHVHKKLESLKIPSAFLAMAESCTGGALSAELTKYSGASLYLLNALVVYSNLAKISLLGVKDQTLSNYGAVSKQVAKEMVEGIFNREYIKIALSITGFAGPKVDFQKDCKKNMDTGDPVGLVYIGLKFYCSHRLKSDFLEKSDAEQSDKNEKTLISLFDGKSYLCVKQYFFSGDRQKIQNFAVKQALLLLAKIIF